MGLQMTWQAGVLKLLKRKHGSAPLGLRNLGNSCYLNSVLQCLTFTPPLASFCLRFLHSSNLLVKGQSHNWWHQKQAKGSTFAAFFVFNKPISSNCLISWL